MTKYKGLFTFDVDSHNYIPVANTDGAIDCMGYRPGEKPKEYWYIDCYGEVQVMLGEPKSYIVCRKQIGDYFETREETEKAAEKLKAWTRLKGKGFVWQGWEEGAIGNGMCVVGFQIPEDNWDTDVVKDLDLLFSGEDD